VQGELLREVRFSVTVSRQAKQTESQALAHFALGLKYEAIPSEVLQIARGHFVDALGIALASSTFDFGDSVLRAARELGKGGEAHAIGSLTPLPAAAAALVNGTLAHGLDFDDTHIAAIYHASAPALAASLAAGEVAGASGLDVLVAFVVALEIGCRLAGAAPGAFHARGLHPTAICGVFAAAAASARLRGADEGQLVSALGIAGSQAGGILEIGDSWLKRLHPGWAAHAGLVADALGRAGFKGPQTVFEGQHGLYASHLGNVPQGALAPSYKLGEDWRIPGIALKPYPCCHFIHGFVDAALAIRDQVPLDQIVRIECPLSPALHHMVAEPHDQKIKPTSTYEALFSVQYVVALALAKGRVDLAAFYSDPLDDPQVLGIAARVICTQDPISDFPQHFPGELHVQLKDGRVIQRREHTSLGTPERRLPREMIDRKFLANAGRALGPIEVERVLDTAWRLDTLRNVSELISLCGLKEGKAA
jgi:2-methylcitrate dehydratase PrpD